jgi:hypothetical protein
MALGAVLTGSLSFVIGLLAIVVFAPLVMLYFVFTHPGIWFLLVNAVRLVRDGRTLKVDGTGAVRWRQDADAIASYVQARMAAPDGAAS